MREEKEELRMEAYYYSFTPTGNIEIDQILSSVAIAGKAHHNTAAWADEDSNYGNGSLVDLIQNRANEAAKQIDALKSELEATKEKLRLAVESLEEFGCCAETCARMGWSCGEPTPDGGYRVKVKGKWHHERPRCDCGFEDALKKIKGEI